MPDFASRNPARTSWVLLPIDETMPIPVTTTRLMLSSSASCAGATERRAPAMWDFPACLSGPGRLRGTILEECDFEITHAIDDFAVRLEPAVRDAEHELGAHHALDVDPVDELFHAWKPLSGELDLARADRAAAARGARPAEVEAD